MRLLFDYRSFNSTLNIIFLLLISSLPRLAFSNDIQLEEPLNFGHIAIKDNNSVQTLRITSSGTMTKTEGLIVVEPGQAGRYLLYGFPSNTLLNIQVDPTPVTSTFDSGTPQATFTLLPQLDTNLYTTNGLGEVILPLGGELTTSGDGQLYLDGEYRATYTLIINH